MHDQTTRDGEEVVGWEVDHYATRVFCKRGPCCIVYSKGELSGLMIRYFVENTETFWFNGFRETSNA